MFGNCEVLISHVLMHVMLSSLSHGVGASSQSRKTDLAKLKSLSATLHKQELIEAARRTYCYRSEVINKTGPTFAACVSDMPCYVTIPAIVRMTSIVSTLAVLNM